MSMQAILQQLKHGEGYRYGYLNENGKEILATEYNEISRVNDIDDDKNYYLICAKNGQYGVRKNEEILLENEYQSIEYNDTNQVFIVQKSKKYGVASREGKIIVPLQYNEIKIAGNYLYATQNEQGTTVYNSNGTQANMDSNITILNTSNEKYKIKINSKDGTKYGVTDKNGKQLIEEEYNYIEYLQDNYFIASNENGKLGILDDIGNTKLEMEQDSLQKIQNTNLIQATIAGDKLTSIYSKSVEKICEMNNATIAINDEVIKVYNEEETKYFSKDGKELKNIDVYKENKLFVAKKNDKYGFVDKNGNVVVDFKYEKAYEFNSYGFAAVKKDGKWGSINEEGKVVAKPVYEFKDGKEPSFIGEFYRVTYGFGEFYYTNTKQKIQFNNIWFKNIFISKYY